MKRVFVLLLVAGLMIAGTSCTSLNSRAEALPEKVGYITVEYDYFNSAAELAEKAAIVLKGTVTSVDNILVEEKNLNGSVDLSPRKIYTVRVEKTYKGEPAETIFLECFGGVKDGIEYTEMNAQPIMNGGKYLFFLTGEYGGKVYTYNPAQSVIDLAAGKSYDGSILLEDVYRYFDGE